MPPADFSLFVPITKLSGYRSYGKKVVNVERCTFDALENHTTRDRCCVCTVSALHVSSCKHIYV